MEPLPLLAQPTFCVLMLAATIPKAIGMNGLYLVLRTFAVRPAPAFPNKLFLMLVHFRMLRLLIWPPAACCRRKQRQDHARSAGLPELAPSSVAPLREPFGDRGAPARDAAGAPVAAAVAGARRGEGAEKAMCDRIVGASLEEELVRLRRVAFGGGLGSSGRGGVHATGIHVVQARGSLSSSSDGEGGAPPAGHAEAFSRSPRGSLPHRPHATRPQPLTIDSGGAPAGAPGAGDGALGSPFAAAAAGAPATVRAATGWEAISPQGPLHCRDVSSPSSAGDRSPPGRLAAAGARHCYRRFLDSPSAPSP
ncbi:unnamed protein product [Prorocentrum cordatum]|uniref:Uncharacterized protein n=1 Tax=Prorocentrum cordatum TaxID=2364126 RepID=A0ABN9VUK1_9DINO|nr:unnamed protein product [Polarella glacialis]